MAICGYFNSLNLAEIAQWKLTALGQDTLKADGCIDNGGKMSLPKGPSQTTVNQIQMDGFVISGV